MLVHQERVNKNEISEELPFFLANCRSMNNKLESINDFFENTGFHFGILTETWTTDVNIIKIREELENVHDIAIIEKSRGSRGGGVAIVYKKSKISMQKHKFLSGVYEILCVKTKIPTAKNYLYVFACYYPPSLKAEDVEKMNDLVCDEIVALKRKEDDPLIIIAGDMNQKNCDIFDRFSDIALVNTGPTRGNKILDLCYTNCPVIKSDVHIPLWSYEGIDSDHRVVLFWMKFTRKKHFYHRVRYRKITKIGEENFCRLIENEEWNTVFNAEMIDDKTSEMHRIIELYKDECFPYKTSRVRSDEDPWITDHIRKLIRKRDGVFRWEGRNRNWKLARDLVRTRMQESKEAYYDRELEKIYKASDKKGLAYTALRNLQCPSRPKQWTVLDMDKEKAPSEVVEELAEYFSQITNEYDPVQLSDIPITFDRPIFCLTEDMIEKRIRESKKPNSTVPGDVPPKLLTRLAKFISRPACHIFNHVPMVMEWPELWKREYQTVIPKKPSPSSFSELRNLSCTNFISKVLESFVIDSLKSEVQISELQYGGMKGCGTDNFLVEVWNNVMETLEDPKKAMTIMSIDFSKAFNRLDHSACLRKLAEKNASNQTIGMIYSFLSGRKMCVRSGEVVSKLRDVNGGSPQGTKLGNLLFCLTIDDITMPANNHDGSLATTDQNMSPPDSAIPPEYQPVMCSTPANNLDDSFNPNPYGMWVKKNIIDDTLPFNPGLTNKQKENLTTWEIGYVDDINVGETLEICEGTSHITVHKEKREIRAIGCEAMYETIEENGSEVGMKINPEKTQLICISPNNNLVISSCVAINGKKVVSGERLKILGFMFGDKPNVKYHVNYLVNKFHRSVWSLFHLKRAGLHDSVLSKVYRCMQRPLLEFGSNVICSMMSKEDEKRMEDCQKMAFRIIYGFEMTYEEMLEKSGTQKLIDRRETLFKKFCVKMAASDRFSTKWLPLRNTEDDSVTLRKRKKYIEFNAKTNRLYNSPLFKMRRVLNDVYQ